MHIFSQVGPVLQMAIENIHIYTKYTDTNVIVETSKKNAASSRLFQHRYFAMSSSTNWA